ncbi:nucleotidyltransferase family protein [Thermococcus sp. 2319x1]|uniref:nucleotidyltransferase family protein n=1 Tax=Thermococcus sp. 2319x1 TaxID=1674923 RepID=UPI001E5F136F|nr:nucleotidyltransferase family protein [Thermococcus sp. 2319x1]
MNLKEIEKILREHKEELRERFKVKEIGIFGSYVGGEQSEVSDVDILVEFYEAPSLFEFIELEIYLSELLGVKVDLVMKKALKPRIKQYVLREVVYV